MPEGIKPSDFLPIEADFDPLGGCLDARFAWRNFGGLQLDDAYAKFCERPDIYQEDFMFMGGVAFAWYFPVVERYVRESRLENKDDYEVEAMWILAHCIKEQILKPTASHLGHLHLRILDLTSHVRGNLSQYCTDPEEQQRIDQAWQELEVEAQSARSRSIE